MNPLCTRSSTQLLNVSILSWLSNRDNVHLLGLVINGHSKEMIFDYYSPKFSTTKLEYQSIDFEKQKTFFSTINNYLKLLLFSKTAFHKENLSHHDNSTVICLCPSIESGLVGKKIKKYNSRIKLITIWTDVLTFNQIKKKKAPIKRLPLFLIEKKLLKSSDKIFYLGKPQCDVQKDRFSSFSNKMSFYNPSFLPDFLFDQIEPKKSSLLQVSYFGSFNGRNIKPLSQIDQSQFPECNFTVLGTGAIDASCCRNDNRFQLKNIQRIFDAKQSFQIEVDADISITLNTETGFSLPGKCFYFTRINRPIIFIVDGPFSNELAEYMESFSRFIVCSNTKEDIELAVRRAIEDIKNKVVYSSRPFQPDVCYKDFLNFN